jgi:hypothetical protein
LASSHCSWQPDGARTPSPQRGRRSRVAELVAAVAVAGVAVVALLAAVDDAVAQTAGRQSVRHASGVPSLLATPSSQISQVGTSVPSPHTAEPGVQSVTYAVRVLLSVERQRRK